MTTQDAQIYCIYKIMKSIEVLEKEVNSYNNDKHFFKPFSDEQYVYLVNTIGVLQNLVDSIRGKAYVVFSIALANYLYGLGNKYYYYTARHDYSAYVFKDTEELRAGIKEYNQSKATMSSGGFLLWLTKHGSDLVQVNDLKKKNANSWTTETR